MSQEQGRINIAAITTPGCRGVFVETPDGGLIMSVEIARSIAVMMQNAADLIEGLGGADAAIIDQGRMCSHEESQAALKASGIIEQEKS